MDWQSTLKTLAPTVATALGGPLAGMAVKAIGNLLGVDNPTQEAISKAFETGQLTPEQISKLKELEMQYQNDEKERGFKYAELAVNDRTSARKANVDGGTQEKLFWLSIILLITTLGSEGWVLYHGFPTGLNELVIGRVLGLMDAVTMMVLSYWYGASPKEQHQ